MATTKRSISFRSEVLDKALDRVGDGSLSAFVDEAVAEKLHRDGIAEFRQLLVRRHGQPDADDIAHADAVFEAASEGAQPVAERR